MATVSDRLKNIIVETLSVEEGDVVPDASFVDDLGADSLDVVEMIMKYAVATREELEEKQKIVM